MPTLLLVHAAATTFMAGLIWFVQVVHYPLGARVGDAAFVAYQSAHMARTTWVVGPPMLVEAATVVLLLGARPTGVPAWATWAGAGLLAAIWTSTMFLQVPAHQTLLSGLDPDAVRRLVGGNWVRTVGWTLRAVLAFAMIAWVGGAPSAR